MVFAIFRIRAGHKVPKKWYGTTIAGGKKLTDIYNEFASGTLYHSYELPDEYNTVYSSVQIGKQAEGTFIAVESEMDISDATKHLGVYIEFIIRKPDDEPISTSSAASDAFTMMMNAAKKHVSLPEPRNETDNKKKLKNNLKPKKQLFLY